MAITTADGRTFSTFQEMERVLVAEYESAQAANQPSNEIADVPPTFRDPSELGGSTAIIDPNRPIDVSTLTTLNGVTIRRSDLARLRAGVPITDPSILKYKQTNGRWTVDVGGSVASDEVTRPSISEQDSILDAYEGTVTTANIATIFPNLSDLERRNAYNRFADREIIARQREKNARENQVSDTLSGLLEGVGQGGTLDVGSLGDLLGIDLSNVGETFGLGTGLEEGKPGEFAPFPSIDQESLGKTLESIMEAASAEGVDPTTQAILLQGLQGLLPFLPESTAITPFAQNQQTISLLTGLFPSLANVFGSQVTARGQDVAAQSQGLGDILRFMGTQGTNEARTLGDILSLIGTQGTTQATTLGNVLDLIGTQGTTGATREGNMLQFLQGMSGLANAFDIAQLQNPFAAAATGLLGGFPISSIFGGQESGNMEQLSPGKRNFIDPRGNFTFSVPQPDVASQLEGFQLEDVSGLGKQDVVQIGGTGGPYVTKTTQARLARGEITLDEAPKVSLSPLGQVTALSSSPLAGFQQTMPNQPRTMADLLGLGGVVNTQGAQRGQPFGQFFPGGIPTMGQFNMFAPEAQQFIQALGETTGTPAGVQARQQAGVTPAANLLFLRRVPAQRQAGR